MSIVLVRVDDRLVHGQVVAAWVPFCKATRLIVASDEVNNNQIQKIAIESCSSTVLTVKVRGIDEALKDMNSEDIKKERVIILFSTLKDLFHAYNKGFIISNVNIGNIHHDNKGKMITPSVYIDKEDEDALNGLIKKGVELEIRAVPSDRSVDMLKVGLAK